jgi:hypothetical protein
MSEPTGRVRIAFTLLAASLLAIALLSGCVTHHHHHYGSWTVRNPSHGHRYVHPEHRVSLVYDRHWGGYWVVEFSHHYYYDGFYFRLDADRWHQARHPHGPWVVIETRRLPGFLHHHHLRIARDEAKQAWKQARQEARQERREDRHEAKQERREERREAKQERREDRHEAKQERREERQEAKQERREDRDDAKQERREEGRQEKQQAQVERKAGKRRSNDSAPANRAEHFDD